MNTDKLNAVKANIERISGAKSSVQKRQAAHIRELCRILAKEFPSSPLSEEGDEFRRNYKDIMESLCAEDDQRIEFARHLSKECNFSAPFSFAQKLLSSKQRKKRPAVTYVKNAIADIAYDIFAEAFEKCSVSYAHDFVSAAEDVYYSKADYVLLPVFSTNGGRMSRFSAIIEKYELKGVLSCRVYSTKDDSETEFLLLSKNTEFFFSTKDEDICFEITVSDPHKTLSPIIDAARAFNASCRAVYTEQDRADIIFDITKADINALCLYIFLEFPRHNVKGIYVSSI